LVLWAAYAEHPTFAVRPIARRMGTTIRLMRSQCRRISLPYLLNLVRNVELWLPSPFEFTFEGETSMAGGWLSVPP